MLFIKVDPSKPVLVAGDPEALHMKQCENDKGISYHINQIKYAVSYLIIKYF